MICTRRFASGLTAASCAVAALLPSAAHADFTGWVVESDNTCAGATRYSVYATFDDPTDELLGVHGVLIDSTTDFLEPGESCLPMSALNPCDSFVTIDLLTSGGNGVVLDAGCASDVLCFFEECGFSCGWNNPSGNGQGIVGADGRVLVGVFAVPDDAYGNPGVLTGSVTAISYVDGDNGGLFFPAGGSFGAGTPVTWKLILLDRTGSMQDVAPGFVDTNCDRGRDRAEQEADMHFFLNDGTNIAIWTFAGNSHVELTNGFVTATDAANAVSGLSGVACAGNTPLAQTICNAIDELSCTAPPGNAELLIITDGDHNVNNGSQCTGPDSLSQAAPFDLGSWQNNVYDKVIASGIAVTTVLWEPDPGLNPLPGGGVPDEVFFDSLSAVSGGYFLFIPWGEPDPPPLGACCLPDGTCLPDTNLFACMDAGGTFAGIASPCSQCTDPTDAFVNRTARQLACASGAGASTVIATWTIEAENVQEPINVATTAILRRNGELIGLQTVEAVASPANSDICGLVCPSGAPCICMEGACGCDLLWITTSFEVPFELQPGDVMELRLEQAQGGATELLRSDDTWTKVIDDDPTHWDRQIVGAQVSETPGQPGHYDVQVETRVVWGGLEEADLGFRLVLAEGPNVLEERIVAGYLTHWPGQSPCPGNPAICQPDSCGSWNWSPVDCDLEITWPDYLVSCECADDPWVTEFSAVPVSSPSSLSITIAPIASGLPALPGSEADDVLVPLCAGDCTGDATVDVDDLVCVILAWGTADPTADLDGSGEVDVDDLVLVILNWGPC